MLFPALWAYRTSVKTATGFTPFHLVFGEEAVLPIECEIPSLHLAVELLPDTQPLVYDQAHDTLGRGKFDSLWLGAYIISKDLGKGTYLLEDFEGHPLPNPRNALYLKKYYP